MLKTSSFRYYLSIKSSQSIALSCITVLNENEFRNLANEPKNDEEKSAINNPVVTVNANGIEIFVRLAAFDDDRRVDKKNNCLRPGTFTTTEEDYLKCKKEEDNPVERYALPNNDEIKFVFHIQPVKNDTLQNGKVQPAYGKRGGGKEAFFAKGNQTEHLKNKHRINFRNGAKNIKITGKPYKLIDKFT